jgi:hypothetical protein
MKITTQIKINLSLSHHGCTGVNVTTGVGAISGVGIITSVGVTTDVDVTAGVGIATSVGIISETGSSGFSSNIHSSLLCVVSPIFMASCHTPNH